MRAVYADRFDASEPLAALSVGNRPEPARRDGWVTIEMRAASLNHHDIWTLRGVGLRADQLPMVLGCDLAGVDPDGREVVAHGVIDGCSILSEVHQGTMAERVSVPRENLLPKPAGLSFEEVSCMPTAWLTAYTMMFETAAVRPGHTVLVQGAGGGLSAALVALGTAAGARIWVTGRSDVSRAFAAESGADMVFPVGARLPERVDAVMDSVGEATWRHSIQSLKTGGVMVVSGGTSGYAPTVDLAQVFARQLRILGSSMGSIDGFRRLLQFCDSADIRPRIANVVRLQNARDAFAQMIAGEVRGKLVVIP